MTNDPRNVRTSRPIPTSTYSDQPYLIKTDDGAWLCALTTGHGHEGEPGQHVVSMRSLDQGVTWSNPAPPEPADGPHASYSVLLKTPWGRVYCFYNHNSDNLKSVKSEKGQLLLRVDTLGYYVFRFSDDHGRTWSKERYRVPVRDFQIDRENSHQGQVRFFWNVGRPVVHQGAVIMTMHKVAALGEGYIAQSEGAFIKSPNLLTQTDPGKILFETLPQGDVGIRPPEGIGRISEEHSLVTLSDGSLFCIYRTVAGHPAYVISRDGARTWSTPAFLSYGPGKRLIKHPRAATFIWRCENGKYLLWFHNHGGPVFRAIANPYDDRNPVWIAGGIEHDTPQGKTLIWSEPEVLLYHDDPMFRMSYPDMIQEGGSCFFTSTHKTTAYVHPVDTNLLQGLWDQLTGSPPAPSTSGCILDLPAPLPASVLAPKLPSFTARDYAQPDGRQKSLRSGFSLVLSLTLIDPDKHPILLDTMTPDGRGLTLQAISQGRVLLTLSDGRTINQWASDHHTITPHAPNSLAVIVDAGPNIILFITNGQLNDGGVQRQFGFGRISPNLISVNAGPALQITPNGHATVHRLRIYNRPLTVSQALQLSI